MAEQVNGENAIIDKISVHVGDKLDLSDQAKIANYIHQLEETNRELDAVFRFSHDGIFVADGNGVGIKYNDSYCRITGINAAELMGLGMSEVVKRGYISESATAIALQSRKRATTMPQLKSGKKALITSNPVFDDQGNIIRIIANVRDITELLALKTQLEQIKELSERYYSEILHLRSQSTNIEGMVAESPAMQSIVSTAMKVAATSATVLITGDSGAGKEVLARAIHNNSEAKAGPFVKVNCGAIPDTLLESELFGYEKGAFTNASPTGKSGIFEIAMGGTLFLDEIGEIPLALQAKLLGVLQDMKFTRVGGTKEIDLGARVIAATNRELEEMIKHGQFRKDLFYRINVVSLKIPPLSARKGDIFPLAHHFLRRFNEKYKTYNTLSPQLVNALIDYNWPGNVREMENLIERLVVLAPNEQLTREMLPESIIGKADATLEIPPGSDLKRMLADVESRILKTLVHRGFSGRRIASELGINQSTVVRKLKQLGITANA